MTKTLATKDANATKVGIGFRQPHYQAILETQPRLGFLEVHSENFFDMGGAAAAVLHQARSHYPISLHGVGLSLGTAGAVDAAHLQKLKNLVGQIDPFIVSDHACFGRGKLNLNQNTHDVSAQNTLVRDYHVNDLLPIRYTKGGLDVLCANVSKVQDTLQRSIAVENVSTYFDWKDADYSEVEFINALCQRTGCSPLLDLNNLYINALNRNIGNIGNTANPVAHCIDWVNGLSSAFASPAEIHLAGFTLGDGLLVDDHATAVHAAVWEIFAAVRPALLDVPVLIEWDTNIPSLEVLIEQARLAEQYA